MTALDFSDTLKSIHGTVDDIIAECDEEIAESEKLLQEKKMERVDLLNKFIGSRSPLPKTPLIELKIKQADDLITYLDKKLSHSNIFSPQVTHLITSPTRLSSASKTPHTSQSSTPIRNLSSSQASNQLNVVDSSFRNKLYSPESKGRSSPTRSPLYSTTHFTPYKTHSSFSPSTAPVLVHNPYKIAQELTDLQNSMSEMSVRIDSIQSLIDKRNNGIDERDKEKLDSVDEY